MAYQNPVGFDEMNPSGLHQLVDLSLGRMRQNCGDLRSCHLRHAFARRAETLKTLTPTAICNRFVHLYLDLGFLRRHIFLFSQRFRRYNWRCLRNLSSACLTRVDRILAEPALCVLDSLGQSSDIVLT